MSNGATVGLADATPYIARSFDNPSAAQALEQRSSGQKAWLPPHKLWPTDDRNRIKLSNPNELATTDPLANSWPTGQRMLCVRRDPFCCPELSGVDRPSRHWRLFLAGTPRATPVNLGQHLATSPGQPETTSVNPGRLTVWQWQRGQDKPGHPRTNRANRGQVLGCLVRSVLFRDGQETPTQSLILHIVFSQS